MASLTLIHTNDLHGRLDETRLPFLREMRGGADLYFDSGDCIKAGNLAVPMRPDPAWGRLAEAGCTACTMGNRESHVLASAMGAKLAGRKHPMLVANLFRKGGKAVFDGSMVFVVDGLRVGVVGVMVPMVTERMKSRFASQFLWTQPVGVAVEVGERLREEVDLLIGLTHIGIREDERLAEKTDVYDMILGGHSHTVLEEPKRVGRTWICQGGAFGKFVGRYVWEGGELREGGLVPWEV